jgi:hypothetical protein
MIHYSFLSSFGSVQVEEVDGINAFREFNSVDGPQPDHVNLLFHKIDRYFTKTITHP